MNTVNKETIEESAKDIDTTDAANAADQGRKEVVTKPERAADAESIRRPRAHFRIRLVAASGESKANNQQKK